MPSTLRLKTSADGRPFRLVFDPIHRGAERKARAIDGATLTQGSTHVTFPCEPLVYERILDEFDGALTVDASAKQWYDGVMERLDKAEQVQGTERVELGLPYASRLRNYQTVGARWLADIKKGILADEPGLGKTIQALAACDLVGAKDVLIVAPSGASGAQWARTIQGWLGATVSLAAVGGREERLAALGQKVRFTIVNHAMIRVGKPKKDEKTGRPVKAQAIYEELLKRKWDVVVVDEAHRLQGRKSQVSRGAKQLTTKCLFLLTGTPIWNQPSSLWHLLHLLDPRRFNGYWKFVNAYCNVIQLPFGKQVKGVNKHRLPELQRLIKPLLFRRLCDDVLPDLPEVRFKPIEYELTPQLKKLYRQARDELRLEWGEITKTFGSTAAALSKLRKLCAAPQLLDVELKSPKDEIIVNIVEDHLANNDQVLIFCWHKDYVHYLQEMLVETLGADCPPVEVITGDTSDKAKVKIVAATQEGKVRILIATLGTIGEAIDFPMIRAGIFAEMDWTPAVNKQGWKRIHRIGTKHSPIIYIPYAKGTVEANVYRTSEQKAELADEILAIQEISRTSIFEDGQEMR